MNESVLQTLTWLIPVGPLAAFALILLVTYRSQRLSFLTAWAGIAVALALSWTVAFNVVGLYFEDLHHLEEHPAVVQSSIQWLPIGDYYAEPLGAAFAHAEDHAADDHAIEEEHKEEEADHKAVTATTSYTGRGSAWACW